MIHFCVSVDVLVLYVVAHQHKPTTFHFLTQEGGGPVVANQIPDEAVPPPTTTVVPTQRVFLLKRFVQTDIFTSLFPVRQCSSEEKERKCLKPLTGTEEPARWTLVCVNSVCLFPGCQSFLWSVSSKAERNILFLCLRLNVNNRQISCK